MTRRNLLRIFGPTLMVLAVILGHYMEQAMNAGVFEDMVILGGAAIAGILAALVGGYLVTFMGFAESAQPEPPTKPDLSNEHEFRSRMHDVGLHAAMGTYDALATDKHLGEAARLRGIAPRTLAGDAYEHAFEWAREEASAPGSEIRDLMSLRLFNRVFCPSCIGDVARYATMCASCGDTFRERPTSDPPS